MTNEVPSMFSFISLMDEAEYARLNKEEKSYIDFINSCIHSDNPKINKAAFDIMMMLVDLKEEPSKYEPEDVNNIKDNIFADLSPKEKTTMNSFLHACIYSLSISCKETKKEMKLKKERK